jgi:hypothetical protein
MGAEACFWCAGAGGGIRTRTRREPQGILSPRRLPFRHPGPVATIAGATRIVNRARAGEPSRASRGLARCALRRIAGGGSRNRTGEVVVLQTTALATWLCRLSPVIPHTRGAGQPSGPPWEGSGAEDGTRTRDLLLGKEALYQLSYFRVSHRPARGPGRPAQGWSGRPDSNRRHPAWEAGALPTELRPRSDHPAPPIGDRASGASSIWWAVEGLNLRPSVRETDALPAELTAHTHARRCARIDDIWCRGRDSNPHEAEAH